MRRWLAAVAGLALAAPAFAVGLSPLGKEGITVGPNKAFYLTVMNPYTNAREFRIAPDGFKPDPAPVATSEVSPVLPPAKLASPNLTAPDIAILPALVTIKPGGQRRVLVVIRNLAPGESRTARVCAQLAQQEGFLHARVCSKLSARRLAGRA